MTMTTTSIHRCHQWEQELELATYNRYVRGKIQQCQTRADEHRRAIEYHQQMYARCVAEANQWETQGLRERMVFPMLSDSQGWERKLLSSEIKHSKELAWALLRPSSNQRPPDAFQRMLWTDPSCPLRHDRNIMLASLRHGLWRSYGVTRIVWTPQLANDKEIVLKCFEMCPEHLSLDPDAGGHLLAPYLQDMMALRAFAFAPNPTEYRKSKCYGDWINDSEIHNHFAPELFMDPTFMADLVVHLMSRRMQQYDDHWARERLQEAFPQLGWDGRTMRTGRWTVLPGTSSSTPTLLDSVDFAIRLSKKLATVPRIDRQQCPITYAVLSEPVRSTPTVALAFAKFDAAHVVGHVPTKLSSDASTWNELWTIATDQDPFAIFHKALNEAPCRRLLESKDLVIRLLEAARGAAFRSDRCAQFAKYFPNFSLAIQQDRDVHMQLVVVGSWTSSAQLQELVDPGRIQSRDFWIDLVENLPCPWKVWGLVPTSLAQDEGLVLVWARRARVKSGISWLADAVARFPTLGLLSDHQVLVNWLPTICRKGDPIAEALKRQVPPECLTRSSLWVEVFQKLINPLHRLDMIPEELRSDLDVVEAQLQCAAAANKDWLLAKCYGALSPELMHRFASYVVRAVQQNSDDEHSITRWRELLITHELHHVPEVALALLGTGRAIEGISKRAFESLAWRNDPEFMLQVADATATHPFRGLFWMCCSNALRVDKAFVLRVLKESRNVPELDLNAALSRDIDIRCARFVRCPDSEIRQCLANDVDRGECDRFPREVRSRLQTYVSLQVFLSGVVDVHPSKSSPVSLLGQDEDTMLDFQRQLVEYLGCPSSVDEAQELRIVSNRLTLVGY